MNKESIECCDLNLIVSDFHNNLKGYLMGQIHNKELAEDVVQEVMLKVLTAHQKNLQVKNLKAWLYQIARNTLIDYYRKKTNRILEKENYINEMLFHLQEETYNPGDYLIPMINLLPSEYRIPLLLSDIENRPQAEIACLFESKRIPC